MGELEGYVIRLRFSMPVWSESEGSEWSLVATVGQGPRGLYILADETGREEAGCSRDWPGSVPLAHYVSVQFP